MGEAVSVVMESRHLLERTAGWTGAYPANRVVCRAFSPTWSPDAHRTSTNPPLRPFGLGRAAGRAGPGRGSRGVRGDLRAPRERAGVVLPPPARQPRRGRGRRAAHVPG